MIQKKQINESWSKHYAHGNKLNQMLHKIFAKKAAGNLCRYLKQLNILILLSHKTDQNRFPHTNSSLTCTGQVYSAERADGPAVQTDCTRGWAAR